MASGQAGEFKAGFTAILPLWLGILPFAIAYSVAARSAGLTLLETQAMSVLVFAGASQFGAAGMFAVQAQPLAIIFTTFLINLRHALYGLNLGRTVRLPPLRELLAAHVLTDEAFGVTAASGRVAGTYLIGAGMSVFVIWNAGTLLGSLLSTRIPDPAALGVDFVFPLAFLALLLPLLRSRPAWFVAGMSGVLALVLSQLVSSGVMIMVTGVAGSLLGAWLTGPKDRTGP